MISFDDLMVSMNFLAHTHLSNNNEDIIFGNFIADSVKGNSYNKYRRDIAIGILLHREIDSFTDNHQTFKNSRDIVRSHFGKFSGIVIDIYYDHFLARDWENYHSQELSAYTSYIYLILAKRFFLLPPRVKRILPFMIGQNWLSGYANIPDLKRVFKGMDRRTGYVSGMDKAIDVLLINYELLHSDFKDFYTQVEGFSKSKLKEIDLRY